MSPSQDGTAQSMPSAAACPAYVKNAEYSGRSFLRIRLAIFSRFSHRPSVVITTRRRCRLPCNSTIKQQIRGVEQSVRLRL